MTFKMIITASLLACCGLVFAQDNMTPAPLVPAADQLALIESDDPRLARNKKHVWDFWRIVYEGGHMEYAEDYMTERYIQHNPNVGSGRDLFINTIGVARPPAL